MRTLLLVGLLTAGVCSAQPARTLETTNNSWNYPNLSIENWDSQNLIVAGTTDIDPASGLRCPVFKFTYNNLNPATPPPPPNPVCYAKFLTDAYLMDFTIEQTHGWIIMTGIRPAAGGLPDILYVSVMDIASGGMVGGFSAPMTTSLIPHQVIYSPAANQVVVVGTEITGTLTSTNFATIPKKGFVMILNGLPGMGLINFTTTDTPSPMGGNDSDMLESVTEIPGYGYFAGGSANGGASPNTQNLMVMGIKYNGTTGPAPAYVTNNLVDRSVAASVMYNPATNNVLVLSNSSLSGTYWLTLFDPFLIVPVLPSIAHVFTTLPPGIVANGFRLQQDASGAQVIVGGYLWDASANLLTPFQATTNAGLTTYINAKRFQTNNSSPLTGYFNESGTSVFINTPDMISYQPGSNRTFLVNPNTSFQGFDMLRSIPGGTLSCETPLYFNQQQITWPYTNGVIYSSSSFPQPAYVLNYGARPLSNMILCSSPLLAPVSGHPTLAAAPVHLSPNPAKDHLEITTETSIAEVVVYDLKGSKVLALRNDQAAGGTLRLDISLLQPGVYIIALTDTEGTIQRERFVKE